MSSALAPDETAPAAPPVPEPSAAAAPPPEPAVTWGTLFPSTSARERVLNYLAAVAILVPVFVFYATLPHYQFYFAPAGYVALQLALFAYVALLPLYYATFPDGYPTKCRLFWRAVFALRRRRPTPEEAVAVRAIAVKAFFMPLMIVWLVPAAIGLAKSLAGQPNLWQYATEKGFLGFYYPVALTFIIIVDLACFTVAYGIEHPRLGNEIKSVEPTFLGWFVALICYPPFVQFSSRALGWYETDTPPYPTPVLAFLIGMLMLVLMGTYAAASVALGLKGGNLVHRGVVDRWPYSVIRHPAYLCKNLFWCVGAVPAFIAVWGRPYEMACVVLSSVAWFGIYTLRALTEERHLMRDPAYQEYCQRVKYRYIPGVW
jgi:protein-S-isoprenylcysteine O-methyltransferase Ste14